MDIKAELENVSVAKKFIESCLEEKAEYDEMIHKAMASDAQCGNEISQATQKLVSLRDDLMEEINQHIQTTNNLYISDDTGSIKDSVSISGENLKYLRDIAERDAINMFTTAEVKVEFGGITNHVSSDADLDGMVTYISDRVAEELEVVAEGVHE